MKVYMDKEGLVSFSLNEPNKDQDEDVQMNWLSLRKFLRCNAELYLNIDLEAERTNVNSALVAILSAHFYSGKAVKCNSGKFWFKRKCDFRKSFKNPDNIFFLTESKESELEQWKSRNGYYISSANELLENWKKINLSYGLPKSLAVRNFEAEFRLKSWGDLLPYQHPVTDAIIADQYILSNKELFKANFVPMLKGLISNKSAHFHLTIFTAYDEAFDRDIHRTKTWIDDLLRTAQFNSSLVLVYDTVKASKEHDRHVITNYFHVVSGDSFTFFRPNGELKTHGTTIDIKPLVDPTVRANTCAVLKNLRRLWDHVNVEKTNGSESGLFQICT